MPATPGKSRASKEKDAVELAQKYSGDGQPTSADLAAILPPKTAYEPESSDASPPRDGVVKGKQAEYYASEQGLHNMTLRAAVSENEDILTTLHEVQGDQVANARQLLAERNRNRAERVREFDEGYRYPDPLGCSDQKLITEMSLLVGRDRLGDLEPMQQIPVAALFASHQEMLGEKLSADRRSAVQMENEHILTNYIQVCEATSGIPEAALDFHDLVHTDVFMFTKAELAKTNGLLSDLWQRVLAEETACDEAVQTDQVEKAAGHRMQTLTLLERLCSTVRDRIQLIDSGSGDGGVFRVHARKCYERMIELVTPIKSKKQTLKEDILADLSALAIRGDQEAKKAAAAQAEYEQFISSSNAELNGYATQQDRLWERIQDMVAEIKELGDKRIVAVQTHVEKTEAEQKRRRAYAEFSEVFATHCKRIEEALKCTDVALKLLDECHAQADRSLQASSEKQIEEESREMRMVELQRYLEYFRHYVLKAGDMMSRRRNRVSGLTRSLRNLDVQLQMCTDAFDPNRRMYEEQRIAFQFSKKETEESLQAIQQRYDEQLKLFQPTQDLLDEAGVDFIPPTVEKDEKEVGERERHNNLLKKFARAEQDEVETEQTQIRRAQQTTKVAKEDLAKRREHRKQLKSESGSPAASLSPAAPSPEAQKSPS